MKRFNKEELIILKEEIKFGVDCLTDMISNYDDLKNISDEDFTIEDCKFGESFNKNKVIKDLHDHELLYKKICKMIKY